MIQLKNRLGIVAFTLVAAIGAVSVGCTNAQEKPTNPQNPIVVISTSMGDMKAELYKDTAPKSVENFLAYTKEKFYDGTIFHRVIPRFMLQGGGFTPDMKQKPTKAAIK